MPGRRFGLDSPMTALPQLDHVHRTVESSSRSPTDLSLRGYQKRPSALRMNLQTRRSASAKWLLLPQSARTCPSLTPQEGKEPEQLILVRTMAASRSRGSAVHIGALLHEIPYV